MTQACSFEFTCPNFVGITTSCSTSDCTQKCATWSASSNEPCPLAYGAEWSLTPPYTKTYGYVNWTSAAATAKKFGVTLPPQPSTADMQCYLTTALTGAPVVLSTTGSWQGNAMITDMSGED